jgi:cell fate (sporulation/competence/biofilm development) regulator YlbF (YheA/YmcA/DUF963 family)
MKFSDRELYIYGERVFEMSVIKDLMNKNSSNKNILNDLKKQVAKDIDSLIKRMEKGDDDNFSVGDFIFNKVGRYNTSSKYQIFYSRKVGSTIAEVYFRLVSWSDHFTISSWTRTENIKAYLDLDDELEDYFDSYKVSPANLKEVKDKLIEAVNMFNSICDKYEKTRGT